jgi:hypothetical protein
MAATGNSDMSIKSRLGTLILILFFVVFFHPLIYALIWPDCSYESTDGEWGDREVQTKGRGFDNMLTLFELYKLRCDAPAAKLVRTTRKNPLNILAWRSYLRDEKWKVEYGVPSKEKELNSAMSALKDELAGKHPCFRIPKIDPEQDFNVARQAAQKFIESLSSVKQPPLFGK